MTLVWCLVAALTSFGGAAAFCYVLHRTSRVRAAAALVLTAVVVLAPWMIPPEARVPRFLISILVVVLTLKMWDVHIGATHGHRPSRREYLRFLTNIFSLVLRRQGQQRQPSRGDNRAILGRALLVALLAAAGSYILMLLDWTRTPFLLEHTAKAVVLFVFGTALLDAGVAVARAVGTYSVNPNEHPFTARTPADFWRNYNRCMGEFLREDVFRQVGGRRHAIRGTTAAFLVSGVIHEYMFSLAVGQVEGFQLAFFTVQGIGVLATARLRPIAWVGICGTWIFNALSSILFFASGQGLIGLYDNRLPQWLGGS